MTRITGLSYNESLKRMEIRELELSITSRCHLRCDNCGFYIPKQPNPAVSTDVVAELASGLALLEKLNIGIKSLGILGGEPTFNKSRLTEALSAFSTFQNVERTELVTHGLTPQNIERSALKYLDKISISIYFDSKHLIDLWQHYIDAVAPHIELSFRKDQQWNRWLGTEVVDDAEAQRMFDRCWYRKHCVSLERNRLFLCSRIAKLSKDEEGLLLDKSTSAEQIEQYLNQPHAISSCNSCTPMMDLSAIQAGQQPDNRILKMVPTAIKFLKSQINEIS